MKIFENFENVLCDCLMNFSIIYISHSDLINIRLYDYKILIQNFRRENFIMNAEDLTCSICLGPKQTLGIVLNNKILLYPRPEVLSILRM